MIPADTDWNRVELLGAGLAITIERGLNVWDGSVPDVPGIGATAAAVVVGVVASACTLIVIDRSGRFWVAVAGGVTVLAASLALLYRRTTIELLVLGHQLAIVTFVWTTIAGLFPAADAYPPSDGSS